LREVEAYKQLPEPNLQAPEEQQTRIGLTREQADIITKLIQARGLDSTTKLREKYANRAFVLCASWLVAILLVLCFQGFGWWAFKLSEPIVLALIGGTTVNVIGLFYFVMKGLFDTKGKQQ
jgi:hypothetical protein